MNTNVKRIILIIVLLGVIAGIVFVIMNASEGKKDKKVANVYNPKTTKSESTNVVVKEKEKATEEKTEEGSIIYKIEGEEIEPEIVLKDNYFDTTISDIMINFNQYEGKTIEIEGLYFKSPTGDYHFVGRYSTSNLCADCPQGYSYFEYEWNGDKTISLKDSEDWIKVVGTLRKDFDNVIQDYYYYIDVASLEIKKEKGLTTVNN